MSPRFGTTLAYNVFAMKCRVVILWVVSALLLLGSAGGAWAQDLQAPMLFDPPKALTNNPTYQLTGQAAPSVLVEVFLGDLSVGYIAADEQGLFRFELTLAEGINLVYGQAYSAQGSSALSLPLLVILDSIPPAVPTLEPLSSTVIEPTQYLFGATEPSVLVSYTLDGQPSGEVRADVTGRFHTSGLNLRAGWHNFIFTATDDAGNQSLPSTMLSVYVTALSQEFSPALVRLNSMGILRGYGDGTFRPTNPVTRAEFAALLARTLTQSNQLDLSPTTGQTFLDVPAAHWAFAAIEGLAAKGFLNGFPGGYFRPEDFITGKEVIAALVRAAGLEREAAAARNLLPNAPWYSGYSIVGAQHGLLYSNFSPDEEALRGEVAVSLAALLDFFAQQGQTP